MATGYQRREQLLEKASKASKGRTAPSPSKKAPSPRALAVAAYKKAHKAENMGGMIAAAGGDMSKLSGLHRTAFPGSASQKAASTAGTKPFKSPQSFSSKMQKSSVKPAAVKSAKAGISTKSTATKATGGAPRPAASYRGPTTKITGSSAPQVRRPSARGVTTVRTGASKPTKSGGLGWSSTESNKQRRESIKKVAKSIYKTPTKAAQATKRWIRKVNKQGFTF